MGLEVFCQEIRSMIVGRLVKYCGDPDVAEEAFQVPRLPGVRALHTKIA